MDTSSHIENWLITAFEEPVDRMNESYYFDRLHNQFFSVFITDYFLLEDEAATNIQSPYSDKEFRVLNDRINRIEIKESSIINLPRLTVEERKQIKDDFLRHNSNSFDNGKIQFVIDNETGRNQFDIPEISNDLKSSWKNFKGNKILQKVESFCNLNSIDIESASLWTEVKATTMSFNLTESQGKKVSKQAKIEKKAWWKFW